MKCGVFQRLNLRFSGAICSIENAAGRENARGCDEARFGQFRCGENGTSVGRGIVNGGDSERQPGLVYPVALRNDSMGGLGAVGMGIHKSGKDDLPGYVNYLSFFWDL